MGLGPAVVVLMRGGATVAVVSGVTVGIGVATRVVGFAGGGVEVVWAVVGAAVELLEVKEVVAFVEFEALEGSASTTNWCRGQGLGNGDGKSLGVERSMRAITPRCCAADSSPYTSCSTVFPCLRRFCQNCCDPDTCSWTLRIISIFTEPIPIGAIGAKGKRTSEKWLVSARRIPILCGVVGCAIHSLEVTSWW